MLHLLLKKPLGNIAKPCRHLSFCRFSNVFSHSLFVFSGVEISIESDERHTAVLNTV